MSPGYSPFGIDERSLRSELERRRHTLERSAAAARAELYRLRTGNAQLRQYLTLLRQEVSRLEAESLAHQTSPEETAGDSLLKALAEKHQAEIEEKRRALASLQKRLAHFQSLHRQMITGVMALIQPSLRREPGASRGKGDQDA